MQEEGIIDWRDLVPLDAHVFDPMKGVLRGKQYAIEEEEKTAVMK